MVLVVFLEMAQFEKKRSRVLTAYYQASLAAESGLSTASAQLALAASNNPTFLVGVTNNISDDQVAPVLMIVATNLTNSHQLMPLISGDVAALSSYPNLDQGACDFYLQSRVTNDAEQIVDLNQRNHPIAATGKYLAPWVIIKNQQGHPIARYAYVFLDEQARLNPLLHQGKPRTDPINWDHGVGVLPISLHNNLLLTPQEAEKAIALSSSFFTLEGLKTIFENQTHYDANKQFLSSTSVALPDLIPAALPEGGHPKYDLNDLATNPIYGATSSDRALYLAKIIDRNLPHFKERDPSLKNLPAAEQCRYLHRLAACIVNYISPEQEPILVNGGEPAGQALTPLVTQTAERCQLLERTSNSVTIENQYFIQLWNPYTTSISADGKATFALHNRQQLHFGTAPKAPFQDYLQSNICLSSIRPNESIVIAFPSVIQTWNSPSPVPQSEHPGWLKGPEGNADPTQHQAFEFYWNNHLVTMSRRAPVSPGPTEGGLEHDEQSLTDAFNFWQCNFIPTEQDHAGHFRFVGDPRENYLSNYLWKSYSSEKSYLAETHWKGVMSNVSPERLFDPATSWKRRDFVPQNPVAGNRPTSRSMTPEQVPSPYEESRDAIMAPLVIRHGPMNSIVELGHINDPAQADDLGGAPNAGAGDSKSSIYASGGGRTLRIGQPEFSYWDVPGKRAIELIDLFTVTSTNNTSATVIKNKKPAPKEALSTTWRQGLININTAPHAVLTALFYGISPTSDRRFTNSVISVSTAEELATFVEEHRPYEKLSDLRVITPLLANATTYTPPLSMNVFSDGPPLAAVFDRARQEGLGKVLSLCTVQSRAFRVYVLGESLNAHGKPTGQALLEASIVLLPQEKKCEDPDTELLPVVQKKEWLR